MKKVIQELSRSKVSYCLSRLHMSACSYLSIGVHTAGSVIPQLMSTHQEIVTVVGKLKPTNLMYERTHFHLLYTYVVTPFSQK